MPDGHWGYGFPIGGVAAFDMDKGIISPGGIGFDINCLAGDTYVLTDLGFTKKIKDFETDKPDLVSFNNKTQSEETSKIVAFMSRQAKNILKIKTKSGIEILATEDHPIFTPNGMVPAADVEKNTNVAVYTFAGVPYQQPSGKTFLTAEDIRKIELPFNKERVIKESDLAPIVDTSLFNINPEASGEAYAVEDYLFVKAVEKNNKSLLISDLNFAAKTELIIHKSYE